MKKLYLRVKKSWALIDLPAEAESFRVDEDGKRCGIGVTHVEDATAHGYALVHKQPHHLLPGEMCLGE